MFKKYEEFINEASMDNFQMYLTKLADHLGDKQLARDAKTRSFLKSMFKKDTDYQKFTDDEVKNLSGEELHNMIKYDKRFNENVNEKAIKGKDAGNYIKMAPKGRKLHILGTKDGSDQKDYISLGKGKWQEKRTGEKLNWIELSAITSALGDTKVFYEGKLNEAKVTAKTIDKLTNEISKLTKDLKDNFAKYKSAKTDEDKKKYMKIAGELTSEKKAKDSELEMAIQNFGADMELDMNFESKVNESKFDIALDKMDKWLPAEPDAQERYYEILNQENWKDMLDFFMANGSMGDLARYGIKSDRDLEKLAKLAMESYGPVTAQRLNESTNRIL